MQIPKRRGAIGVLGVTSRLIGLILATAVLGCESIHYTHAPSAALPADRPLIWIHTVVESDLPPNVKPFCVSAFVCRDVGTGQEHLVTPQQQDASRPGYAKTISPTTLNASADRSKKQTQTPMVFSLPAGTYQMVRVTIATYSGESWRQGEFLYSTIDVGDLSKLRWTVTDTEQNRAGTLLVTMRNPSASGPQAVFGEFSYTANISLRPSNVEELTLARRSYPYLR